MNLGYPSFWKNASSKRKRIYLFLFFLAVAIIATIAGSLVPLSTQDSQTIYNRLNQTVFQNQASGTLAEYIFLNNFQLCLIMFIPLFGAVLGIYVMFSTGVALGAELRVESTASVSGSASSISPSTAILALALIGLVFLLEYVSYSIGISESVWLFRRLTQRRWSELKNTGILIGIITVLLLVGALVEAWTINAGL